MRLYLIIPCLILHGCDEESNPDFGPGYSETRPNSNLNDHDSGMNDNQNPSFKKTGNSRKIQPFNYPKGLFKVQSGRQMRERVFPVTLKLGEERMTCPGTKPASWTDLWFTTCQEIVRQKLEINNKDFLEKTTNFPSNMDKKELFNTSGKQIFDLKLIKSGSSVLVYQGRSEDRFAVPQRAIFKYQLNCDYIYRNNICEPQVQSGTMTPACTRQLDEDSLVGEYVFSQIITDHFANSNKCICPKVFSLSPPVSIETSIPKTKFKLLEKAGTICRNIHSSFRLIVEEEIGSIVDQCLHASPPGSKRARAKFAIGAFIQTVKLLQDIHSLGILHGDIHQGNIGFRRSAARACDYSKPEDLVLIDFGLAEFFPADFGKQELISPGAYDHLNPVLITHFELQGHRRGRRDDIYRALQDMVSLLSGGELFKLYSKIAEAGVFDHLKFARLKSANLWSGEIPNKGRFRDLFPAVPLGDNHAIVKAINNYSGTSYIRDAFSPNWDDARNIIIALEVYVKGFDAARPLPSPETEPDYDWILEQATELLDLIN